MSEYARRTNSPKPELQPPGVLAYSIFVYVVKFLVGVNLPMFARTKPNIIYANYLWLNCHISSLGWVGYSTLPKVSQLLLTFYSEPEV